MSENTRTLTLDERILHVGGRVNPDHTVTFGSPMAVRAMMMHLCDDLKHALLHDDVKQEGIGGA